MSLVTLKAHYDGKQICLDEPIELAPNTPVLVAIPQPDQEDQFREEWFAMARAAFARSYSDDEPDYSETLIRKPPTE